MLDGMKQYLELEARVPSVHNYIHDKMVNRESKVLRDIPIDNNRISQDKIKKFLYDNMIPKVLHEVFLKEMELYGLIKITNKKWIEIVKR